MLIGVDFDQTLYLNDFPDVGQMVPFAKESMKILKDLGHELVIFSGRANSRVNTDDERRLAINKMKEALDHDGILYDRIDLGDEGKLVADCYIDDKGIGAPRILYGGRWVIDWKRVVPMIMFYEVSHERVDQTRRKAG